MRLGALFFSGREGFIGAFTCGRPTGSAHTHLHSHHTRATSHQLTPHGIAYRTTPHHHPFSHNARFKTDEERLWRVGMVAALDRKGRAELSKALAARRLALRDAAADPSSALRRGPAALADRMAARLAEMEAEVRRVEAARQQ